MPAGASSPSLSSIAVVLALRCLLLLGSRHANHVHFERFLRGIKTSFVHSDGQSYRYYYLQSIHIFLGAKMSPTRLKSSSKIAIELDSDKATYLPGDTLTGHVRIGNPLKLASKRKDHVQVRFSGHVYTQCQINHGQTTSYTEGRAVLFDFECTQSPSNENLWPFSVKIPGSPHPGFAARGNRFKPADRYLHTHLNRKTEIDVTTHVLPPTLHRIGIRTLGYMQTWTYIEYILVAKSGVGKAVYPIQLRKPSILTPITDHGLHSLAARKVIRSLRLLPEHADTKLTFG
jgi:hypothetical protein